MRKRLYRSRENKMIRGVCGGLGEFTGINAGIFRLIFLIASFAAGASVLIYFLLSYIIPLRPLNMKPEYTYVNADYKIVDEK